MKKDKFRKLILNEGQALLIVLLSMSVILSVVLSVVSRSITDISVSTYEEEALRAFSAAEAGIEKALVEQTSVAEQQISTGSADKFKADIVTEAHGKIFNFPQPVKSGETATFAKPVIPVDSYFSLSIKTLTSPCGISLTTLPFLTLIWSGLKAGVGVKVGVNWASVFSEPFFSF